MEITPASTYSLFFAITLVLLPTVLTTSTAFVSTLTPTFTLVALEKWAVVTGQQLLFRQISNIEDVESADLEENSDLIFDVLWEKEISLSLRQTDLCIHHTCINGNPYPVTGMTPLFPTPESEVQSLAVLLPSLSITRFCLFRPPSDSWLRPLFSISTDITDICEIIVSDALERDSLKLLLRKEVKAKGYTDFVLHLPAHTAESLFAVLSEMRMDRVAITVVMTQKTAFSRSAASQLLKTSAVFTAAPGCEWPRTDADLIYCRLLTYNTGKGTGFNVVETQLQGDAVIGSVQYPAVTICEGCYQTLATTSKAQLTISFNSGTMNPSGDTDSGEKDFYLGSYLAVANVNEGMGILPYHELKIFNVSLGMWEFKEEWVLKQLDGVRREDMGIALLTGQFSGVAMPAYSFLQSHFNSTLPQIGSTNTSPYLSSPKEYPFYTRIIMSDAYMAALYVQVLKRYGWTRLCVLYCDDPWCGGIYEIFAENAARAGIEIANNEGMRLLPTTMDAYPTSLLPAYQNIIDTAARVVILILYGNPLFYSIDVLYDLGMRRGDLVFLAVAWLVPSLFDTSDMDAIVKRKELLTGSIQFYPASFIGALGTTVKQRFTTRFGMTPAHYACFFYDGVLLVAHAVDDLITIGKDYESAATLEKQIRGERFVGCTGVVTIEDGKNDRSPMMYEILNAQGTDSGGIDIQQVGRYDPSSLVLFNFSSPILWPDGTSAVPSDTRSSDIDCPFFKKQIVTFLPGVVLSYAMLLVMSSTSLVVTAMIWKRYWNVSPQALTTKAEISFEDYTLFATIGIEAMQYSAMGPEFPSWSYTVKKSIESVSWDLRSVINLSQGVFWIVLTVAYGCIIAWIGFLTVLSLRLDRRLKFVCGFVGDIGEKLLPILGNLCFLPIISILMSVFLCEKAVDSGSEVTFTDSYLQQDCYQRCWTHPHLLYAVVSFIGLFFYLPLAVYYRPMWQTTQLSLHITTSPGYLMLKTVYQIAIITLSKVLKDGQPYAHIALFLISTMLFLGVSLKRQPYNYPRANLWHYVSLICVLWLTCLTLLNSLIVAIPPLTWLAVFFAGLGAAVLFGFLYQHFKTSSMLFRSKGRNVVELFRLQFLHGNKLQRLFQTTNNEKRVDVTMNSTVLH